MKPQAFNYNDYLALKAENEELKAEIARHKELEAQGRLIELPCKVGDMIWTNAYGMVTGHKVLKISYDKAKDLEYFSFLCECGDTTIDFYSSDIGETVFFNREDAEKALEAMK